MVTGQGATPRSDSVSVIGCVYTVLVQTFLSKETVFSPN